MNIVHFWKKKKIFESNTDFTQEKYYCLSMIPYPSGDLHLGHIRNYSIGDVFARFNRFNGKNVLYPIAWDSYGLPAENAAINLNIKPEDWTIHNIYNMKKQLFRFGISYDWSKEFSTSNPLYSFLEQKLLKKLFKNGIIFKNLSFVNWCIKDKTVLANEQIQNNTCWRCQESVKKKFIYQWFLKTNNFSFILEKNLKNLYWPYKIKIMQKKWIKNRFYKFILFIIPYSKKKIITYINDINNNIKNIKFIFIRINHPFILLFIKNNIFKLLVKIKIPFIYTINKFVINPLNKNHIFIKITNNIKKNIYSKVNIEKKEPHYYSNILKKFLLKSNLLFIIPSTNIKDWCISRQRLWGNTIPIYYSYNKINTYHNTLLPIITNNIFYKKINKLFNNNIQKNKNYYLNYNKNILEKDTVDTFLESSWYYLKLISKKNKLIKSDINYWIPIDIYIGGIEHSTMHLIYIRLMNLILNNFILYKKDEPIKTLLCQGMILSNAFYYKEEKKIIWINKNNIENDFYKNKTLIKYGLCKMSKSKKNFINMDLLIKKFNSDSIRLILNFLAPIEKDIEWNDNNIVGCYRFLNKIKEFIYKNYNIYYLNIHKFNNENINNKNKILEYFIKINKSIKEKKFNITISNIMSLFNFTKKINQNNIQNKAIIHESIKIIIKTIYLFSPFITFKLWKYIFKKNNIDFCYWPNIDKFL